MANSTAVILPVDSLEVPGTAHGDATEDSNEVGPFAQEENDIFDDVEAIIRPEEPLAHGQSPVVEDIDLSLLINLLLKQNLDARKGKEVPGKFAGLAIDSFPSDLPSYVPDYEGLQYSPDNISRDMGWSDPSVMTRVFGFTGDADVVDYNIHGCISSNTTITEGIITNPSDADMEYILRESFAKEKIRFYTTSGMRKSTRFSSQAMRAIWMKHDMPFSFYSDLTTDETPVTPFGARTFSELWFNIPMRMFFRDEVLANSGIRFKGSNTNARSALDVPGSHHKMISVPALGVYFKHDISRGDTIFFLRFLPNHGVVVRSLYQALKRPSILSTDPQATLNNNPFFVVTLLLEYLLGCHRAVLMTMTAIANDLDEEIQNFIDVAGDESTYLKLTKRLHTAQRHGLNIQTEMETAIYCLDRIEEQHRVFTSEASIAQVRYHNVENSLKRIKGGLRAISNALHEQRERIKTSLNWLATSISLKNDQAMKENGSLLRELAEQTRIDNKGVKENTEAMKKIAEISKEKSEAMSQIAIDTRKDSQSMKIVAFLTMAYLPGSFVSGIFGWSIIDFSVSDDGTQDITFAKQWWVYIVATLLLTVATMFGCFIWIHRTLPSRFRPANTLARSFRGAAIPFAA